MKCKSKFIELYVEAVSECLQNHMKTHNISSMTADDSAIVLDNARILKLGLAGPPDAPSFMFRQLLRDGRDCIIPHVKGVYQKSPRCRWIINRI